MITEQQVRRRLPDGGYVLGIECKFCHQEVRITVTGQEMFQLQTSNKFIQQILPNHTASQREMFITGMCSKCWDDTFKGSDDE